MLIKRIKKEGPKTFKEFMEENNLVLKVVKNGSTQLFILDQRGNYAKMWSGHKEQKIITIKGNDEQKLVKELTALISKSLIYINGVQIFVPELI